MTDTESGNQATFFRCMDQQFIDAKLSVEIDGNVMNMGCLYDSSSSATTFAVKVMLSLAALFAAVFA